MQIWLVLNEMKHQLNHSEVNKKTKILKYFNATSGQWGWIILNMSNWNEFIGFYIHLGNLNIENHSNLNKQGWIHFWSKHNKKS